MNKHMTKLGLGCAGLALLVGCYTRVNEPKRIRIEYENMCLDLMAETARPDRFRFFIEDVTKGEYQPERTPLIYAVDLDLKEGVPDLPKYGEPFDFDVIRVYELPENHPFKDYSPNKIKSLYQEYIKRTLPDDAANEKKQID